MWDLPGPGLKPVSPALAGGFLTTAPPGKSKKHFQIMISLDHPSGPESQSKGNFSLFLFSDEEIALICSK